MLFALRMSMVIRHASFRSRQTLSKCLANQRRSLTAKTITSSSLLDIWQTRVRSCAHNSPIDVDELLSLPL